MAENKGKPGSYVGKITNAGNMVVEAPLAQSKKDTGVVKSGDDLRSK